MSKLWVDIKHVVAETGRVIKTGLDAIVRVGVYIAMDPFLPILIGMTVAAGLVWMFVAYEMIDTAVRLHGILEAIAGFSKIVQETFVGVIQVFGSAINGLFSAVNDIESIFSHHHSAPHFSIPTSMLLNFAAFFQDYAALGDMNNACRAFSNWDFEFFFLSRYYLNDSVCPSIRYRYGTFMYTPMRVFLWWAHFNNTDPNGANCAISSELEFCFTLFFWICIFIAAIVFTVIYLFKPLRHFYARVLVLIWYIWETCWRIIISIIKAIETIEKEYNN